MSQFVGDVQCLALRFLQPLAATSIVEPANAAAAEIADAYYWEDTTGAEPPVTTKVAHTIHWLFAQVYHAAEYVGEVFSDIMGLENPRYQWAVEAENNRVVRAYLLSLPPHSP